MEAETDVTRRETWLVLRAQSGDVSAWDALLLATQGWLNAYLHRLVRDRHLADDVMQEVFLRIFRKLKYLHEPRAYRAWVYRTATREAMRQIRKKKPCPELSVEDAHAATYRASGTVETMDEDLRTRLAEEIEHMPPNTRAVLVLHYFEGLSIRQLADVLGIKTGTAKSRLAYGLARLRTPTLKEIAG